MPNYYKRIKTGNWIGIDKVATFDNSGWTALASGNIMAIDYLARDWEPKEPKPILKPSKTFLLNLCGNSNPST